MNRTYIAMLALSLTLAAGCGGTSSDDSDPPSSSTCSGTVTGSVTATITDCGFNWLNNSVKSIISNRDHISSTADDDNQFGSLGFSFIVPSGPAMTGTLDSGSVLSLGGGLELPNHGSYSVSKPESPNQGPTFGTLSIHITSFEPGSIPNLWTLHGTLSAGLETPPGVTTYSGSAQVSITF